MGVRLGFLATLEAKPGKANELAEFLRAGASSLSPSRARSPGTRSKSARTATGSLTRSRPMTRGPHINGPIAQALGEIAGDLLASDPVIQPLDVIAVK
jgi:hypothetical protein